MYSFNKYFLSIQLSALRVVEYNESKADMVPGLSSQMLVDQVHLSVGFPFSTILALIETCLGK